MNAMSAVGSASVTRRAIWAALVLLLMLYVLFPFYWMILSSFRSAARVLTVNPSLLPNEITFSNYQFAWYQMNLARFFFNSTLIAIGTTILALVLTTPASYGLSRGTKKVRNLPIVLFLIGQATPPIVLLTPIYVIMSRVHLTNSFFGVIIAHSTFGLPFALWLQSSYFRSIPIELDEAAMIDGAGIIRCLVKVIIPISSPGIIVAGLFVFVLSWDEFLFAYTLTASDAVRPITAALFQFIGANVVDWGGLMAGACIATLPIALVFFSIQRWLIEGLTAGAIKG